MRGNAFSCGPGCGDSAYNGTNGAAGPYADTGYGFPLNTLPYVYDGLSFRWVPM